MTTPGPQSDFIVQEPLILIFVGTSIGNDLTTVYPSDVYAAVRGWWAGTIQPYEASNKLILARNTETVLGAFRAKRWIPCPFDSSRWGFIGEVAELQAQLDYVGKRIPNEFRTQNPIRYLDPK